VGDVVGLSRKERLKLMAMGQVAEGQKTLREAGEWVGLSYRQVRRVWRRYQAEGAAGLAHRGRGRESNRRRRAEERAEIVEVYRARLEGFGPTLASEKLAEWEHEVDHETLRRWLIAAGLWQRQRKRGPHRRWREPRRRFGELVQVDGSHHDWFGNGQRCCLMNMVDDATGHSLARMDEEETTVAAMQVLWSWVERHGVPSALYVDGKTVYVTDREATAEEQLAGEQPLTEFGKACRKLGIRIILAHSAPAKGRVERKHGVYQDRFVKELALRGITTIEEANGLLEGGFVEELNRKFGREPLEPQDAHRPVPEGLDLATVFAFEESRTVANDWTIRYESRWYQITGPRQTMPRPKARVTVQRWLDESLHILYRERELTFREVALEARVKPKAHPGTEPQPSAPRRSSRPASTHPWRRPFSRRAPSLTDRARPTAPPPGTP
jgi:transposase